MNNLNIIDKKVLIDDFKNFISKHDNIKKQAIKKNNKENLKWYLYCDIETFRFNLAETDSTPRNAKNATWILQVAYFVSDNALPSWVYFKDFREFLNIITEHGCKELTNYDIILVFHNGFKYDNIFLEKELVDYLQLPLYNTINKKATNKDLLKDIKDNEIKTVSTFYNERDHDYVTVSSVRASTSHALTFSYKGLYFETEDSFLKTNDPLERIGQKCFDMKILEKEYIKDKDDINFKDDKYNIYRDLDDEHLEEYKAKLLNSLTKSEFKYVRNDVVVLAMCHKHFSKLYYGFDWNEFTFTGNVKKAYENNGYYKALTNFQLTKKTPSGKMKQNNKYGYNTKKNLTLADKTLAGWKSAETFFRQYYRGGLNMYNERYVGTIIEPKKAGFSMDLNSSYPTIMYKEKLPTYLVEADHFGKIKRIPKNTNYFYMFTVTPKSMDNILNKIQSRVIRQMFVKYYPVRNDGYIYINSVALNTLEKFMPKNKRIQDFKYVHYYKWKTEPFGGRNVIKDNYFIKQHGKSKDEFENVKKGKPFDPLKIKVLKGVKNNNRKTPEEVQASKVLLNGIYGIPAMRPTFPQFVYREDGSYISCHEGHENQERNVVFSVGVTAFAFRNLIEPLTFLTAEEIDEFFWYCDTDSLYLDGAAYEKVHNQHLNLFDPNNLGCWDLEHKNIVKFYPLNHKKYALFDTNDKKPLTIHAGGVSSKTVDKWKKECTELFKDSNALNHLVDTYFHNGVTIKTTRSVLTNYKTVDIYEGESILQDGLHDKNKTKHYPDSYQECKNWVKNCLDYISKNYEEIMVDFDNYLADINTSSNKSALREIIVDGYSDFYSYDSLIAIKKFVDGVERPVLIEYEKLTKKDKEKLSKEFKEQDEKLIHTYKSYRNYIDWQNDRLPVVKQEKIFSDDNLKAYFGCPYLAKEMSGGVYLTIDFRVIRKEDLYPYTIEQDNFAVRYVDKNGKKHTKYVFSEFVRLFFNVTIGKDSNIKYIEDFLDNYNYNLLENQDPEKLNEKAFYRHQKVKYKNQFFRDPENDFYKSKKKEGLRIKDLLALYYGSMDSKLYDEVTKYIEENGK